MPPRARPPIDRSALVDTAGGSTVDKPRVADSGGIESEAGSSRAAGVQPSDAPLRHSLAAESWIKSAELLASAIALLAGVARTEPGDADVLPRAGPSVDRSALVDATRGSTVDDIRAAGPVAGVECSAPDGADVAARVGLCVDRSALVDAACGSVVAVGSSVGSPRSGGVWLVARCLA